MRGRVFDSIPGPWPYDVSSPPLVVKIKNVSRHKCKITVS